MKLRIGSIVVAVALLSAGCSKTAKPASGEGSADRTYPVQGLVVSVDAGEGSVTVSHDEVTGFMPAMTMPFTLVDAKEVAGLQAGQAIKFDLLVSASDAKIAHVQQIDPANLAARPEMPPTGKNVKVPRLKEGDAVPDFRLVDQEGVALGREAMLGNRTLITFIFTRCPVPNFCPLMATKFGTLQESIQSQPALAANTRLLSISFDPFDTPAVLKEYAGAVAKDSRIWRFASGDAAEVEKLTRAFSVLVQPEAGTISHGLCTALVNEQGVITHIWRGNGWGTDEVLTALQ